MKNIENTCISIVMPMKNAEKWVIETISSIQNQSHEDWELLIVDDHSTDQSVQIVQKIANLDPRISLFTNPSEGIISCLQTALNKATGTFLTRMDADDIMPPLRLEQMLQTLLANSEYTIVTGKVAYFSDQTVSEGYLKYQSWLNDRVDKKDFYDQIYRECVVASPNWMVHTATIRKHGIFDKLRYPEDYDMCFWWQTAGFSIVGINDTTLLWREHPQRISRNSDHYQQAAFFALKLDWFKRNFKEATSVGIVGMGQKGKLCAHHLQDAVFQQNYYDLKEGMYHNKPILQVDKIKDELLLIARYPNDPSEVQLFIERKGYVFGKTAFWV